MFALRAAGLAGIALLWKAVARVQVADQEAQKQRGLSASDVSPFMVASFLQHLLACRVLPDTQKVSGMGCTAAHGHKSCHVCSSAAITILLGCATCIHQAAALRCCYLQHVLLRSDGASQDGITLSVYDAEALLPGALICISALQRLKSHPLTSEVELSLLSGSSTADSDSTATPSPDEQRSPQSSPQPQLALQDSLATW